MWIIKILEKLRHVSAMTNDELLLLRVDSCMDRHACHVWKKKPAKLSSHDVFQNISERGYWAGISCFIDLLAKIMHLCHQPIRPGDGYYIAFILSIPKLPMRSECSFIKRPANGRPCSPAGYNSVLTRKHTSIRNKLIWVLVHIKGQLYVKVQLRLLFSNWKSIILHSCIILKYDSQL